MRGVCCFPTLNSEPIRDVMVPAFFSQVLLLVYVQAVLFSNIPSQGAVIVEIQAHLCFCGDLSAEHMACMHGKATFARHSLSFYQGWQSIWQVHARASSARKTEPLDLPVRKLLTCRHCSMYIQRGMCAVVHLSFFDRAALARGECGRLSPLRRLEG